MKIIGVCAKCNAVLHILIINVTKRLENEIFSRDQKAKDQTANRYYVPLKHTLTERLSYLDS